MKKELQYLANFPKQEFPGMKPTRVIHQGLKNRPDLKETLGNIIMQLQTTLDNENSHLSDIAGQLNFASKELSEFVPVVFKAHKDEIDIDL